MNKKIGYIVLGTFCLVVYCAVAIAFQYESRGKRDPFVPLVGIERPAVVRLADIMSVEDVKLEGIAIGAKGMKTAIINGELVKEGYKAGDVEVKSIKNRTVTIAITGKDYNISLAEEGRSK